jgi:hypothetical protein
MSLLHAFDRSIGWTCRDVSFPYWTSSEQTPEIASFGGLPPATLDELAAVDYGQDQLRTIMRKPLEGLAPKFQLA